MSDKDESSSASDADFHFVDDDPSMVDDKELHMSGENPCEAECRNLWCAFNEGAKCKADKTCGIRTMLKHSRTQKARIDSAYFTERK